MGLRMSTYYVSPSTGNDNNSGLSLDSPFESILKAYTVAAGVDSIVLMPDEYDSLDMRLLTIGSSNEMLSSTIEDFDLFISEDEEGIVCRKYYGVYLIPESYSPRYEALYVGNVFPNPTINLTFSNGSILLAAISWDSSTYDMDVAGTYTVEGYYEYEDEDGTQQYPVTCTLEVSEAPTTLGKQFRSI